MSELISRADAIEAIQNAYCKPCKERGDDHNEVRCRACEYDNAIIQIDALPSAEAPKGELISRADAKQQISEWATIITNPTLLDKDATMVVLDTLPSAEAEWIPCSKDSPKELEPVMVTWVNHNPPCYYIDIMGKPFTAMCVLFNGNWYWWDSTICDVLEEYGEQYAADPINKYIEVIAWMPLPEPYKYEYDEN